MEIDWRTFYKRLTLILGPKIEIFNFLKNLWPEKIGRKKSLGKKKSRKLGPDRSFFLVYYQNQ